MNSNLWFQIAFLLIFLCSGFYYVVKGLKGEERKVLFIGILLLTLAWTKIALLLRNVSLNSFLRNVLFVSEIGVPLIGAILACICVKKWRPYLIGLSIFLIMLLGFAMGILIRWNLELAQKAV